jgi:chromosome segregation ATPase
MSNEAAETSNKQLVEVIEKIRQDCTENLEAIREQITELQESVADNNKRIARLIKIIDDIQKTIVIIEKSASDLNTKLATAEGKASAAATAVTIGNQNYGVIRNYSHQLAKQIKELKREVGALREDVDTHSSWWIRLAAYAIAGVSIITGIIYVVHEYVGWVHLIQVLGSE